MLVAELCRAFALLAVLHVWIRPSKYIDGLCCLADADFILFGVLSIGNNEVGSGPK